MTKTPIASIRVLTDNPDHHLWNNNGTFWCHYTLHFPDYTKRRVRQSLRVYLLWLFRPFPVEWL